MRVFLFSHSIRSFCAAWLLSQRPVIMWDSAGKSMTGSRLGIAGYGLGQQTVRERKHGQSQGSIQADFCCCLTELPVPRFLVPAIRCNRSAQGIGPLTLAWTEITWGLTHNSRKHFNKALSFSTGWILQRMCESFVPFLAWYSMWYNGIVSYRQSLSNMWFITWLFDKDFAKLQRLHRSGLGLCDVAWNGISVPYASNRQETGRGHYSKVPCRTLSWKLERWSGWEFID